MLSWLNKTCGSHAHSFVDKQEYNPGGGKDEVLKYLEEAKKQVILAKNALKTIVDVLEI